jgi:hypothetical protein
MNFVPIIFTASGGMGERPSDSSGDSTVQNPHWIRVAEEDAEMHTGQWAAKKSKAFWHARFAVAVANCDARMISRSQARSLSTSLIEPSFRTVGHFCNSIRTQL